MDCGSEDLKILVVMPAATQRGGAEMALVHLLGELPLEGTEWSIAFLEEGTMPDTARAAGAATYVLSAGHLRQIGKYVRTVVGLRRIIHSERPDLVFSWMPKGHLYASPAARLCGVPVLWFQMGFPVLNNRNVLDRVLYALPADGIISCGSRGALLQREVTPRVPVQCVNLAVDLKRFDSASLPSPHAARVQLGLPVSGPIVGIVARLERWKGVHTLLNAAPTVLQRRSDVTFVVVGGPHPFDLGYADQLAAEVNRLNLESKFLMVGAQTNVPLWMQAMDIFVHASDAEPFGIVIVEAMGLGKPVIAGSVGGPTDIITERVNGLLVDFEDHDGLASRILEVLDDQNLRQALAQGALTRAQDFSTAIFARKLTETLRELTCLSETADALNEQGSHGSAERALPGQERM